MPFGFSKRRRATAAAPPNLPEVWEAYADRIPADRVELARQLEECRDFRVVDAGHGMVFIFLYDDARGLVGDDAIEGLADSLPGVDGVDDMWWPDREIIEVSGAITSAQLGAWLVAELASTGDPHYWDDRQIEL